MFRGLKECRFCVDCKLSHDGVITEVESLNAIHCRIDLLINSFVCVRMYVTVEGGGERERREYFCLNWNFFCIITCLQRSISEH